MKRIAQFFITCILVCMIINPTAASEKEGIEQLKYDETNSFQVTVKVEEKKVFTPKDFPEIACTDVYVAEMTKGTDCYYYTLIIECEGVEDISQQKERIKASDNILEVRDNEYITNREKSSVELSHSSLFLKVGESADINITEVKLIEDITTYTGIEILLDPKVYNADNINSSIFQQYGISDLMTAEQADAENLYILYIYDGDGQIANDEYFFGRINVSDNRYIAEQHVKVNTILANVEGVEETSVYFQKVPGGEPPSEVWEVKDNSIASIVESGGEPAMSGSTVLVNKTVSITGIKPGSTKVKVRRAAPNASAIAECEIGVYIPGDVDLNSEVTAEDALEILKHVVKLKELPKVSLVAGDMNEDEEISATDALGILRNVVGLK